MEQQQNYDLHQYGFGGTYGGEPGSEQHQQQQQQQQQQMQQMQQQQLLDHQLQYQYQGNVNHNDQSLLTAPHPQNFPPHPSRQSSSSFINSFNNHHGSSFSSSPFGNGSPGMLHPPSSFQNIQRNSLSESARRSSDLSVGPGVGSFSEHNVDHNNNLFVHRSQQQPTVRTSLLTKNLQMLQNSTPPTGINTANRMNINSNNNNNNPEADEYGSSPFSRANNYGSFSQQIPTTSSLFQKNTLSSYTPFHNTPSVVSNSYTSAHEHMGTSHSSGTYPAPPIPTTNVSTDTAFASGSMQQMQSHMPPDYDSSQLQLHSYRPGGSGIFGSSSRSSFLSSSLLSQDEHLNIAEHPTNDLLLMLSALLQKIIELNDLLHPEGRGRETEEEGGVSSRSNSNASSHANATPGPYTANVLLFHGRNVPLISLHLYLTRILKYCPVTNDVLLSLLVYFDRILKRLNAGDYNNGGKLFVMDSYNIHRLIISGVTVLSKFFSDVFYKNSRYLKVGGLPLDELNHLELQFLLLLDFKLMIQLEEMVKYGDLLIKFWKREQLKAQLLMMAQ